GQVAALIKPQFEAGREEVGKHGIIRDPEVHKKVIENVISYANESGFSIQGLTYSPITGGEGNIEFLGYFLFDNKENAKIDIDEVVDQAHNHF
ncbi:MAG TPA: TlyA family rRNA (cytidine-2'-O)-methyltransferase, partial [Kandleria vitulina]|nr:TlyA family rRNA (cytidine-2'-O)-methyltransferase [Kandleria vitulina]